MNKNATTVDSDEKKDIVDEAARKVADAALAIELASHAAGRGSYRDDWVRILSRAADDAEECFYDAVREYRALTESQEVERR